MPFLTPIIAAVSTALLPITSFIASLGVVGQALIGVGLQLALSGLKGKKKASANQVTGTQLDVQYGAARAREIGLGLFATAGHDIYTNTFGKSNKYIQKVFQVSDFMTTSIVRVAVNGEWKSISTTDVDSARGAAISSFGDLLRVKFYDGRQTTADANLIAQANPSGRWGTNHIGRGLSYVIVTAVFDDEKLSSFPTLLFEIQGAPLYDLRKDSTNGGSGSHRWNNQSTWEYTANPILQVYNYERGFYNSDELMIGKNMPNTDLPPGPWMTAANICDESVSGAARYRSGCIVSASDGVAHRDNIEPILRSAGAALVERVDGDQPIVGANQTIVVTIYDDDIIIDSTTLYQAKRSRTELINSVWGSYNSPADLWSATAYPPRTDATALAADRERHATQVDFATIYDLGQAIRLADIAFRENRYQASATITVRPRFVGLEAGDWIRWNSDRFGNRVYRVVARSLQSLSDNGARNVTLTLHEVGNGIYDSSVTIPEITPRTNNAAPDYNFTVPNFNASATTASAANGRSYPAIYCTWDAIEDVTVNAVLIEYWMTDEPTRRVTKNVPMPAVSAILFEGLLPLTRYTLHAAVITTPARPTLFSVDRIVETYAEDLTAVMAELSAEIQEIIQNGGAAYGRVEDLVELLASSVSLNNQIASNSVSGASARIVQEQTVRASETSALAQTIDGVQTSLSGAISSAVTSLTSQIDIVEGEVTAQAELIDAVAVSVGNLSASGLIRFSVVAASGSGGTAYSRIAILSKAANGDTFKESGIYIDTTPTTSVILIRSDKFIVTDGTTSSSPFVVEGGLVKLALARFQNLTSVNGKMVIDGSNGTISIYD